MTDAAQTRPDPQQDPVLDIRGVTHDFAGRRSMFGRQPSIRAVDDVSFRIDKGDVLGIVGESGSGKTTLSKIMLGLIRPSQGEVLLHGKPVADLGRAEIARHVQFIFQDPYSSLNPRHRVGALIAQPMALRGIGTAAEREARAREMLDVVGLPARMFDAYPNQMSGGQRQRVAIARALTRRPEILICDEPTSALDVSIQAQVLNLLLELRKEFGLTYVIVSHNISVIRHMTTRVGVMYLGRMVEMNRAEALFARAEHPYTQVLLDSALSVAPDAGIPDLQLTPEFREQLRRHPAALHG